MPHSTAISVYIDGLTSRATAPDSSAQAIRLSTIAWPETISMTMMKAVIGPWVVADRKPTMPSATSATDSGRPARPASRAMSCPSPAPIASEGAKVPAGTPLQADSQVATNFSSV